MRANKLRRPDYIAAKIALEAQRRRHAREAQPGCGCPFCITADRVEAIFAERARLQELLIGKPPF